MESAKIYDQVREHYSAASRGSTAQYNEAIAKSFGYSEEELSNIPEGANLGLSCGNPLAIASLREGETVVDLGSGAGFDVFLASSKIGPTGHAIGVDMNDDMLARANSIKTSKGAVADNVSFVKGNITDIPLESDTTDCIISNCVINLVPAEEKHLVFKEMHRILKSGGRVAVSDILAKKELPEKMRNDLALYVGCIAGTSQLAEYEQWLKEAGFDQIVIADTKADLNAYLDIAEDGTKKSECCIPSAQPTAEISKAAGCCGPTATEPCCSAPKSTEAASCCASTAAGSCCSTSGSQEKSSCSCSCCKSKETDSCCSASKSKETTSCCSPKASEGKTGCCSSEIKASCCSSDKTAGPDLRGLRDAVGKTDLNEWVGSYKIYAVKN